MQHILYRKLLFKRHGGHYFIFRHANKRNEEVPQHGMMMMMVMMMMMMMNANPLTTEREAVRLLCTMVVYSGVCVCVCVGGGGGVLIIS